MNRAAALAYLQQEYRELMVDAKLSEQQMTDAENVAIDNSLRYLQVPESELSTAEVEQSNVLPFLALLGFFLLKRIARILAIRFDVEAGNGAINAKRSQAFRQIQHLIDEARAEVASLGIVIGETDAFQMGRLNLDFLEPSLAGSEF
jgi:hypothetical protein